jgi:diadenosine tetraphosphatase ApaH/serine/threonine PP2A family protein phosphatase
LTNQLKYSLAPKRCAVWRYVQDEDRIAFLLDLPSRGDTCFPAWIEGSEQGEITLYNYSSDIEGEDLGWAEGQAGATHIYRHTLRFTPREGEAD